MSDVCNTCGAALQDWHPGEPFECEVEQICYVCDLDMCQQRVKRVLESPLSLYLLRCRRLPFMHQVIGIETVVKHASYFALFDDMGAGKTLQAIVSTVILYLQNHVDRLVVVAPAAVRPVWFDPDLGELKKHLFRGLNVVIHEFHAKTRTWKHGDFEPKAPHLQVMVTNYEFIRSSKARVEQVQRFCTDKTMVILDESSAVKNHRAEQTKACLQLRRHCGRVILLNGTPIANSPLDMYSQGQMMDPKILDCKTYFHFRSKYAKMGGFLGKQIIGWQNLEDLQKRFAPHVLRRLKKDCLDLPEKLPSVPLTVMLSPETWAVYREMRDEMVTWLSQSTVSIASQAGVKAMRLAQICSGFLGGVQEAMPSDDVFDPTASIHHLIEDERRSVTIETYLEAGRRLDNLDLTRPSFIPRTLTGVVDTNPSGKTGPSNVVVPVLNKELSGGGIAAVDYVQEIGREKLDAFLSWLDDRLVEDPNLKLLVWCRFRHELRRTHEELTRKFKDKNIHLGTIWGGQKEDLWKTVDGERVLIREGERGQALRLLDPRTAPPGPVIVLGTTATGSMGLNLTAAHTVIYLTNDFNLKTRLQSEDRVHRPGQRNVVSYTDLVASGPTGQKTVDHIVMKALRNKEDVANWTTRAWIAALTEE